MSSPIASRYTTYRIHLVVTAKIKRRENIFRTLPPTPSRPRALIMLICFCLLFFLNTDQVFGVCGAVDVLLARKSFPLHLPVFGAASTVGSAHVSFNPKGNCFMAMEAVIKAMPHARHMLMYRDPRKVGRRGGGVRAISNYFWGASPLYCFLG